MPSRAQWSSDPDEVVALLYTIGQIMDSLQIRQWNWEAGAEDVDDPHPAPVYALARSTEGVSSEPEAAVELVRRILETGGNPLVYVDRVRPYPKQNKCTSLTPRRPLSRYGGYCVFAQVEDDASFAVVDAIAAAIKAGGEGSAVAISGVALF